MYVCLFVCIRTYCHAYKNVHMSRLGNYFAQQRNGLGCQGTVSGEMVTDKQIVSARRLTTCRKRRKRECTHRLELDRDQRVG